MRRVYFAAVVMILMPSSLAWAWGCTGHEVVALIALQSLRPDVAVKVHAILAAQDHNYRGRYCSDLSLDSMAYFATWADDYRTGHPETAPWHFWDVPLNLPSVSDGQFCGQGCVTQALRDQLAILKDTGQDAAKRGDALKFIVHFIGDLHQPLHTEDNNDRGGNCVPTDFLARKTKETDPSTGTYSPNLHGLWDTEIVEYVGGVTTRTKSSVEAFAVKISSDQAAVVQQAASEPVDFAKWGLESHAVARQDPYAKLPQIIEPAKVPAPVAKCSDQDTSVNLAKKHESIQTAYINAVSSDVVVQLAKAGGRLAAVLNSAWVSPN